MAARDEFRRERIERARRFLAGASTRPPIAEKADDLEAIKKAVEDAASVSGGLWLSYLFVLFYIAVAAGAVTHVDLLLENPVKLPFLNIELPLKAFFFLAPILFLVTHAYTLAHFRLLADKAKRFHAQLREQIPDDDNPKAGEIRSGLRRQLPSNIFVQFLAGPDDTRESWFGVLLKVIAWTTLVVGPILLLLLLQIQFLPYHDAWITWTHRLALLAELLLVWWLWRAILSGRGDLRASHWWTSWAAPAVGVVASFAALLFSWTVATFPGEWQEDHLPSYAVVQTKWVKLTKDSLKSLAALSKWCDSTKPESLHDWTFAGEVDKTTRRRKSPFSNTLVLPGLNIYEALKIDDPKKLDWKDHTFDLRGRRLEGAVFDGANLARVDLTGAQLQGASLQGAQLQGAMLEQAHLQGAILDMANLQGAVLYQAQLQGASLLLTRLQGASLGYAKLQGTLLFGTNLQGAVLPGAQLQGASLHYAQLQGASLKSAQIQGASRDESDLTAARLEQAFLWRADFGSAKLGSLSVENLHWAAEEMGSIEEFSRLIVEGIGSFDERKPWSENDYLNLKKFMERDIPAGRWRTRALKRIEILDCEKKDKGLAPCDPKAKPPPIAEDIEKAAVDEPTYRKALAASLDGIICNAGESAIYILRGLLRNNRIKDTGPEAAKLAERIQGKDCPVSAALTQDDRERLREAVEDATPTPAPKPAAGK